MFNIGRFFYKKYFEGVNFRYLLDDKGKNTNSIVEQNKKLLNAPLEVIPQCALVNQTFTLKVAYPGLITGTGIIHTAKLKEEFKLGMHFDYTSGMPVLYGSSVKGNLRSAFKLEGYIADLVESINQKNQIHNKPFLPVIDWKLLEENIFEGKDASKNNLSVYQRDVFFDAVITQAYRDRNDRASILAPDSITPHKEGPLKDPVPITFVKIAPGVKIEFRFKLTDFPVGSQVFTKDHKRLLFRHILADLGIGAKTNVGYGQFKEAE